MTKWHQNPVLLPKRLFQALHCLSLWYINLGLAVCWAAGSWFSISVFVSRPSGADEICGGLVLILTLYICDGESRPRERINSDLEVGGSGVCLIWGLED
jgi:hypothetical protein